MNVRIPRVHGNWSTACIFSSKKLVIFIGLVVFSISVQKVDARLEDKSPPGAIGSILKYEGTVLIRELEDKPKKIEMNGEDLHVGSSIRTRQESQAYVKFIDGSKVILQSNAQLNVKGVDYLQVDQGVVLFDIAKIKRSEDFKVGVKLAILGIRGTQFMVDARDDEYKVYLKQGNMFIKSQQEEFELIKETMQDEFGKIKEAFKNQKESEQKEFAEYNKNLNKELKSFVQQIEFVEYAGISIQGKTARRVLIPDFILKDFEQLERF